MTAEIKGEISDKGDRIISPVDLSEPGCLNELILGLNENGFVTFSGMSSPDQLLDLSSRFGTVIIHRDSDEQGITTITPVDEVTNLPGYAGFSNKELFLHTDGTAMNSPASLLVLYCHKPAISGGESSLLDGKKLWERLSQDEPHLLAEMTKSESAIFGPSNNRYLGSIFFKDNNGIVSVRFRNDNLGSYSGPIAAQFPRILELMDEEATKLTLKEGEGYIINNRRSLHGRTPFVGQREMYRVLVNSNGNEGIKPGFQQATLG